MALVAAQRARLRPQILLLLETTEGTSPGERARLLRAAWAAAGAAPTRAEWHDLVCALLGTMPARLVAPDDVA